MSTNVIQLARLEELAEEELHEGNLVRVVVLDVTESASSEIPGLRMAGVGVHVRAINDDGHVLACYLPVATIQLFNGRREGDPTWQAYDEAWEKAEALKERVLVYLQAVAADKGFSVRAAGVIDIGQMQPLRATWKSDPARRAGPDATSPTSRVGMTA
jgi:hypothetical protein